MSKKENKKVDWNEFEKWVLRTTYKTLWEHEMLLTDEQYGNFLEEQITKFQKQK